MGQIIKSLKRNIQKINLLQANEYDHEEHSLFLEETLNDHLISDVPISSTLSGGVDSSYIASTSSKHFNRNLNCFTLTSDLFESEINKDSDLYKIDKLDVKLVSSSGFDYKSKIEDIVQKLGAPFLASWIHQDNLFEYIANTAKIKVVLIGEGADEIYSGYKRLVYPYLYSLELDKEYELINSTINSLTSFLGLSSQKILSNYSVFKSNLHSETDYEDYKYKDFFCFNTTEFNYERYFPSISYFNQDSNKSSEFFYKSHLMQYLGRADIPCHLHTIDHLSMSYGLEARVPFIDIDLIYEVFKYSYKFHFQNGFNKYMLRKASNYTPESIRYKRIKLQRPGPTSILMYNELSESFLKLLSKDNPFLNNKFIIEEYNQSRIKKDPYKSFIWFRIYTFMIFWEQFF